MSKFPDLLSAQAMLGRNVLRIRKDRYLTQEQVAELARLHPVYVSCVERGDRNVSIQSIAALAFALEVPMAALLDETQKKSPIAAGKVYKSKAKAVVSTYAAS
jgi:transcriptional regulator with XRE-family HTH domain